MLAPQFSLRWLIAAVTMSGLVCVVVAAAARGHLWAFAVTVGLVQLAAILVLHAAAYAILRPLGVLLARRKRTP